MLVSRLNDPDRTLVETIIAGSANKGLVDDTLFAVSRAHGWAAGKYSLEILFATCSDAQIANQVGNDFKHGGRAAGDDLSCKTQ